MLVRGNIDMRSCQSEDESCYMEGSFYDSYNHFQESTTSNFFLSFSEFVKTEKGKAMLFDVIKNHESRTALRKKLDEIKRQK